jgi:hypothetical protein
MQKHCINKLTLSDFAKQAFKRATSWYTRELKKPNGKSSYKIARLVQAKYDGVGPHAATIWRYVNANLVRMSPLKPGVKGDVPAWAFKSLCVAFESYIRICQINSKMGEISYKKLAMCINTVLKQDYRQKMLQRVLSATANNLDALVLDMSEDEWESLKALREADAGNLTQSAIMPEDNNNILCALEAANETIGGENNKEAV